jgi:hypothetical protein
MKVMFLLEYKVVVVVALLFLGKLFMVVLADSLKEISLMGH